MSMSKDHLEDWEKDLQEGYSGQTVPTNDQDFAEFMDKLEDNGYFEEKKKRRFIWYFLGAIGLSVGIYLLTSTDSIPENDVPHEKMIETPPKVEVEHLKAEPLKEKIEVDKEPEIVSKPKTIIKEVKQPEITKKETVISNPVITDSIIDSPEIKEVIDETPLEQVKKEPEVTVTKKKPTVIIMTSDTTVVRDTSHVKEKRRKKKKK